MNQSRESALIGLLILIVVALYTPIFQFSDSIEQYLAGVFFTERITPQDLHDSFRERRLNILIVPGHDTETVGAQFRSLRESDLNARLGEYLYEYLAKDESIGVFRTRSGDGSKEAWFETYVRNNVNSIRSFRDGAKDVMNFALREGHVSVPVQFVEHNTASENASIDLYGVNKWANETGVDIVIHLHFNDYPTRYYGSQGKYRGFAIYAPESQLPNSRASIGVARSIQNRLSVHYAKSNFPGEKDNVVEDQDLIAIGSNATRDGASILIEYGYIYEPQLQDGRIRDSTLQELAYLTYKGIVDYFVSGGNNQEQSSDTTFLPHFFTETMELGDTGSSVLALQAALVKDEVYPPQEKSLHNCPLSGYFGDCTKKSVIAFQNKYMADELFSIGLTSGTGIVGVLTREALNSRHSREVQ